MNCELVANNAAKYLANYLKRNNLKGTVTGISGGLDSAVVYALAAYTKANYYPDLLNIGCILPCYSSEESAQLGRLVLEKFDKHIGTGGIHCANLDAAYDLLINTVLPLPVNKNSEKYKIMQGNVKARLRMMYLYNQAALIGGLVLSTDNLSEYLCGFWTQHGDIGAYGMCQNLWKGTEMYELAEWLGVPQEIIDARPTDDLGIKDGGDEAQLGGTYAEVDKVFKDLLNNGFEPNGSLVQLINYEKGTLTYSLAERCLKSKFKRIGCINLTREELGIQ